MLQSYLDFQTFCKYNYYWHLNKQKKCNHILTLKDKHPDHFKGHLPINPFSRYMNILKIVLTPKTLHSLSDLKKKPAAIYKSHNTTVNRRMYLSIVYTLYNVMFTKIYTNATVIEAE